MNFFSGSVLAPNNRFRRILSRWAASFVAATSLAALILGLFAPLAAVAQQTSQMRRIGVLMDNFQRAATYADRILKGATPSELPIQAPVKFELIINVKTAKALGLTIPQSLMLRADQVVE